MRLASRQPIDDLQKGFRARLDHISADRAASHALAAMLRLDQRFALGIFVATAAAPARTASAAPPLSMAAAKAKA